jgi:hypothetical protein
MPALKSFLAGLAGGMVGAAVVAGVVGGMGAYYWKRMGSFLPIVIEFTTDQNAKFYVYGYITTRQNSKKAKLVIPPFALNTATATVSAASTPLLGGTMPLTLTPIAAVPEQAVKVYAKDPQHFTDGVISMSVEGVITIKSSQPSGVMEAWGLAQEVSLEYNIA